MAEINIDKEDMWKSIRKEEYEIYREQLRSEILKEELVRQEKIPERNDFIRTLTRYSPQIKTAYEQLRREQPEIFFFECGDFLEFATTHKKALKLLEEKVKDLTGDQEVKLAVAPKDYKDWLTDNSARYINLEEFADFIFKKR